MFSQMFVCSEGLPPWGRSASVLGGGGHLSALGGQLPADGLHQGRPFHKIRWAVRILLESIRVCIDVCILLGCVPLACWPYWAGGLPIGGLPHSIVRRQTTKLPETSFVGGNNLWVVIMFCRQDWIHKHPTNISILFNQTEVHYMRVECTDWWKSIKCDPPAHWFSS